MFTLLLDGDILCYRAGFAAEKRKYFDVRKPPSNGGLSFSLKKEALLKVPQEFLDWERELEPLENALYNCKSLISTVVETVSETYQTDDIDYITYLSGNDEVPNFRRELTPDYKANRSEDHKPTHLEAIKEYLVREHSGHLSQGCEADDFFGQGCLDTKSKGRVPIIVSIDKDLRQISGVHLNLVSQEVSEVTPNVADLTFWRQMLEGDRADNIHGIPGVGPKKAAKCLPEGITNGEAEEKVKEYYQETYQESWKEKYNLNCDLLWIWRKVPDQCPFKVRGEEEDSAVPK